MWLPREIKIVVLLERCVLHVLCTNLNKLSSGNTAEFTQAVAINCMQ